MEGEDIFAQVYAHTRVCMFVYFCRLQVTSLTRLFKTRGFVPRMVFCGSCDSRLFGEALVKAGVRHVVAAAVEKQDGLSGEDAQDLPDQDGLSGEDAQDLPEAQYTVAHSCFFVAETGP